MCSLERKGGKRLVIVIVVIIIALIPSSTILWYYFNPHYSLPPQNLNYIGVTVELDYNETMIINYTQVKIDLETIGYNVTIAINEPHPELGDNKSVSGILAEIGDGGYNRLSINIFEITNETTVIMNLFYSSPANYTDPRDGRIYNIKANEESIATTKEYMIYRADEIAKAINLSVEWENLVWDVAYGS